MTRLSFPSSLAAVLATAALLSLLLASPAAANVKALAAAGCDLMQLGPCASAFAGKESPPPSACCSKLKAHGASCLCRYREDPNLRRLTSSSHSKRVFSACKVPVPSC